MEHSFDINIAKEIGINEAIVLKFIWYWIEKNKANEEHYYNDRYWTYNSNKALCKLFPYMTSKQIRYVIDNLAKKGVIIKGNFNKKVFDQTLWYAITDYGYDLLQNRDMEVTKMATAPIDEIGKPIPIEYSVPFNNKELSNTNVLDIKKDRGTSERHRYGEYQNVLLSDDEIAKLKTEFPSDWEERIEKLSRYIESKGAKYKSHLATIRNWARMETERNKKQEPKKPVYEDPDDFYKTL